jgi:IS5 family transposase
MVKIEPKTISMITTTEEEIIEKIVQNNHVFRKLNSIIDFEKLISPYRELYSSVGTEGIDIIKGFKALLIQFWENYSDREMEKVLQENVAVKWFCGFGLTEETPDHSYFGKLRKRLGTENIADIFNSVNTILRNKGLFGDVFTFIDASSIVTKTALWEERDKALKDGEEKLNNRNVTNYTADKDAKWGAKNKNTLWFGYKRHNAVDMRYGFISQVAVTPANVPDYKAIKDICPSQGMVFMDKGYDYQEADQWIKDAGATPATLRKNNNKQKNFDLDRWRSRVRMPFESTFSKQRKRAQYRGQTKVLFQCLAEALVYNLKKTMRILPSLATMAT